MKRSVQTFSVAFVVFLAVGLYQAWEQRRHEDKYDFLLTLTAEYIDRHLERPLLHPPAFSYRCNSQQLFRYDIDAASFLELNVNPLPAAGPLKSSLSNVEIASLMTRLHATEIIRIMMSGERL